MCTTSHEILHTVELCSFCKAGKIAIQDIYTSLQLKQSALLYVYDGVISTAGIQNAKWLTVSQICISSKKVLVV